jgi:hypothetical protein
MQMTPMLKRFYQELQEWIDAGQPRGTVFEPDCGLCLNLEMWGYDEANQELADELVLEQSVLFAEAGLDSDYPFDDHDTYIQAHCDDSMYTSNPERLAWVKEHAK